MQIKINKNDIFKITHSLDEKVIVMPVSVPGIIESVDIFTEVAIEIINNLGVQENNKKLIVDYLHSQEYFIEAIQEKLFWVQESQMVDVGLVNLLSEKIGEQLKKLQELEKKYVKY